MTDILHNFESLLKDVRFDAKNEEIISILSSKKERPALISIKICGLYEMIDARSFRKKSETIISGLDRPVI